jgi:hypothetical protein
MVKNLIFRGVIALSLIMFAFTFSNCANTENLTESSVSDENPLQYDSDQTFSALSETGLAENSGLLALKISGFNSEDYNVQQGYIVIESVEVKNINDEWITVSNYGSEGNIFEPVSGDETTYAIDSFQLPANSYKKIRLNIDSAESKVLVEEDGDSRWVDLATKGHNNDRLKVRYDFNMENQYVLTMALNVEVEKKSDHRSDHSKGHGNDNRNGRHNSNHNRGDDHGRNNVSHVKINVDVFSVESAPYAEMFPETREEKPVEVPAEAPTKSPEEAPVVENPVVKEPAIVDPKEPALVETKNDPAPVSELVLAVQASPVTANLFAVTDNGSERLTAGASNSGAVSLDGINWQFEQIPASYRTIYGIATNGSTYVAVGESGIVLYSTMVRGVRSWATGQYTTGSYTGLIHRSVTYGNQKFIAVSDRGGIIYSVDGSSWTQVSTPTASGLKSVTWNGKAFIAAGDGGVVIYSADGLQWFSAPAFSSVSNFLGVASNGTTTILVGMNGQVWQTRDFAVFTDLSGIVGTNLNSVAFNGSMFSAVGDGGIVVTSVDGMSWVRATSVTTNNLRAVYSATGTDGITHNTIVGDNGIILTSR